jgi:NAD+ diphosphatase
MKPQSAASSSASIFHLGPQPALGYTDSYLSRAAQHRDDAEYLASAEAAANSGVYAIAGELIILQKRAGGLDPLFAPSAVRWLGPAREKVFLGLVGGAARFAVGIDVSAVDELKARGDLALIDLRSIAVQGLVTPEHLAPIAEAKAMLHWHARHRFCSNCGQPSEISTAGWKRECPSCKAEHFPRTDPVVIMLAIDGDRCLLGRQSRFVPNTWSCLAGFVEPGETIEEAARREIQEEAGVLTGKVTYFRSQPWPFPMTLMIGAHAQATSTEIIVDRAELEDARWFTRAEAASMLARTHPDGLATPPPVAIAHHIIRAFVEAGSDVLG